MQIIKVYGPYNRKEDNRKIVVLRLANGKLTTKSYARFLYEQENGLIEDINLTVDHIDEDETNDVLSNFQLLTRSENIKKSAKQPEMYNGTCDVCGKLFTCFMRVYKHNRKQGKKGPYCSKSCAGKVRPYKSCSPHQMKDE